MAKSLLAWGGSRGHTDNTTWYGPIVAGNESTFISSPSSIETPIRFAGVLGKLFSYVSANTASVSSVITLMWGGTATAIAVTYTSDQTGIKESTGTATVAATDEFSYRVAVPTEVGTNTLTLNVLSLEFTPNTAANCLTLAAVSSIGSLSVGTTTGYIIPFGKSAVPDTTSEDAQKFRIRETFTASNFYVWVANNTRTTTTTFATRKNGADGNQSVSYTAGQTGAKEDTSNSDSLVAGDDFNYRITNGGGGGTTITTTMICTQLLNTSGYFLLGAGVNNGGVTVNFNVTTYVPIAGSLTANTTESVYTHYPRMGITAKELVAMVQTNTIATSASVLTVRDNFGDAALTVSYDAGQTGLKNDSSNAAVFSASADEMDVKIVTPNTSGALNVTLIGCLGFAGYLQSLTDSFVFADSAAKSEQRTISDRLMLIEKTRIASLQRMVSDQLILVEKTRIASVVRSLRDPLVLLDTASRSIGKALSDRLILIDGAVRSTSRTLTDRLVLIDVITTLKAIFLNLVDRLVLNDTATKSITRLFVDRLVLIDTARKTASRTLTDAVAFSDAFSRSIGKHMADPLIFTDSIQRTISRRFVDALKLIDDATASIVTTVIRTIGSFVVYSYYNLVKTIYDNAKSFTLYDKGRSATAQP